MQTDVNTFTMFKVYSTDCVHSMKSHQNLRNHIFSTGYSVLLIILEAQIKIKPVLLGGKQTDI